MKSALFALLLGLSAARAQYTVDWFTMDAGGGSGAAGSFAMQGTIGQPDAVSSSAGNVAFFGGYWSLLDEALPALRIFLAGPDVVLAWPAPAEGFLLQASPSLTPSDWSDVSDVPAIVGDEKQVRWGLPVGSHFFRLHRP